MARQPHSGVTEQRKASLHRWKDAQALFQQRRWRGAMYVGGYAVECRLKFKLMKRWKCMNLEQLQETLLTKGIDESLFTHNLDRLLVVLEAKPRLRSNRRVWEAFSAVNLWRPSWRYSPDLSNEDEANHFLESAEVLLKWIDHNC